MRGRMMLACAIVALIGAVGTPLHGARACDPDNAVTNDYCDGGDRAAGRRVAEDWGSFYARRQAEVDRQYQTPEADPRWRR